MAVMHVDPDDDSPVAVRTPEAAGAFVFASPHSGVIYPADMAPAQGLTELSLRSAEDAFVDELIAPAFDKGAALVLGRVGRAYIDLNRDPLDLDAELIEGAAAGGGARSLTGYGVIPRLSGDGRPLYARRLTLAEAGARITRIHTPYHAALEASLRSAAERCGQAILIDWHSMPSRAVGGARGADVVLGDRHGSSCDPALTRRVRSLFESVGWRVAVNKPYAGGWSTQHWGRPTEGLHALQIELSRALYLDEFTMTKSHGWARCRSGVDQVITRLLAG